MVREFCSLVRQTVKGKPIAPDFPTEVKECIGLLIINVNPMLLFCIQRL